MTQRHFLMTVSPVFLSQTIEQLSRITPVCCRKLFSGYGIYCRDAMFAMLARESLYFRADDYSRQLYEYHRMLPFSSTLTNGCLSDFYQLPLHMLDNPEQLYYWMQLAMDATMPAVKMGEKGAIVRFPPLYESISSKIEKPLKIYGY